MSNTPASHEEYLIAVGKVAQNAALSESIMATSLKFLLKCPFKTASAILFSIDSFSGKKNLLNRVVAVAGDEQDKELIGAIISAAEKTNNQRREVAHALVMSKTPDKKSPFVIRRPKSSRTTLVTKSWLSHLMRQSYDAGKECFAAFQQLAKKHRAPPKPEI